jgi:hypothetical protein
MLGLSCDVASSLVVFLFLLECLLSGKGLLFSIVKTPLLYYGDFAQGSRLGSCSGCCVVPRKVGSANECTVFCITASTSHTVCGMGGCFLQAAHCMCVVYHEATKVPGSAASAGAVKLASHVQLCCGDPGSG